MTQSGGWNTRKNDKMPKKLTFNEVKKYVKSRGCKLLSKTYERNALPLDIEFSCGHVGTMSLNQLQNRKYSCCQSCTKKECSTWGGRISCEDDYICSLVRLGRDKFYIAGTFKSMDSMAEFNCEDCGKRISKKARYATKKHRHILCVECARKRTDSREGKTAKKNPVLLKEEIEAFAPSLHLITDTFYGMSRPADFFCDVHKCNHSIVPKRLYRSFHINRTGNGIVRCPEEARKICAEQYAIKQKSFDVISFVNALEHKWHIKCLETVEQSTRMKKRLLWQCMDCGNKFYRTLSSLKTQGSVCRRCCKYVAQTIAFDEFRKKFPDAISEYGFNYANHRYRFDGYSPSKKIALEWNGRQHYSGSEFFDCENLKFRDKQKKKYAKCNGIQLIALNGTKIHHAKLQEETIRNMVSRAVRKALNER